MSGPPDRTGIREIDDGWEWKACCGQRIGHFPGCRVGQGEPLTLKMVADSMRFAGYQRDLWEYRYRQLDRRLSQIMAGYHGDEAQE